MAFDSSQPQTLPDTAAVTVQRPSPAPARCDYRGPIPHLRDRSVYPARLSGGYYVTSQEPGIGSDLAGEDLTTFTTDVHDRLPIQLLKFTSALSVGGSTWVDYTNCVYPVIHPTG